MKARLGTLTVRSRLMLAVVAAVGVATVIGIVGINLLLESSVDRNVERTLRARAQAELASLTITGDRIVAPDVPVDASLETAVWVFADSRPLVAPRTSEDVGRDARDLAEGGHRTMRIGEQVELYALPVSQNGRRLGTIVAGASLAPYHETRHEALLGSLALGAGLLVAVVALAWWLLGTALRPVARMTADAQAWSERDLDRRFTLGEPRDELTRLAATLDGLLDRLAASLRREQRFTAELSHELRTPLAHISAEAQLALRRERDPSDYRATLETILRRAEQMTRTVDALVAAERHEGGLARARSDIGLAAAAAAEACSGLADRRGIDVAIEPPATSVLVGADADLLERILQPVVENACRYGHGRVRVRVAREAVGIVVKVDDDGPGVAGDEVERIFEPGVRGSAAAGLTDGALGAGLGLALSRRLARAAGGELEAHSDRNGGRFALTMPAG
jgi:two-component system OmpR family sensor kinase